MLAAAALSQPFLHRASYHAQRQSARQDWAHTVSLAVSVRSSWPEAQATSSATMVRSRPVGESGRRDSELKNTSAGEAGKGGGHRWWDRAGMQREVRRGMPHRPSHLCRPCRCPQSSGRCCAGAAARGAGRQAGTGPSGAGVSAAPAAGKGPWRRWVSAAWADGETWVCGAGWQPCLGAAEAGCRQWTGLRPLSHTAAALPMGPSDQALTMQAKAATQGAELA